MTIMQTIHEQKGRETRFYGLTAEGDVARKVERLVPDRHVGQRIVTFEWQLFAKNVSKATWAAMVAHAAGR